MINKSQESASDIVSGIAITLEYMLGGDRKTR